MSSITTGRMGARHLTQIMEESDSREHSCFLPPITQQTGGGGGASEPTLVGKQEVSGGPIKQEVSGGPNKQEVSRGPIKQEVSGGPNKQEVSGGGGPPVCALSEPQDDRSLLQQLGLLEAELRESVRVEEERQREVQFLRQQENKLLWQDRCYLGLSQRLAKPWVSSYFTTCPMHMYCLPVQAPPPRRRRRGLYNRK